MLGIVALGALLYLAFMAFLSITFLDGYLKTASPLTLNLPNRNLGGAAQT